jgi:dimethylaniline monooxygenase (N-oxide forming)
MVYECVIVGAGPGGIVCAKELLENGIDNILCIEKTASIGGIFRDTYDSLTLTSSPVFSMFSDYWVGDDGIMDMWSKQEVLDYWGNYVEHFKVLPKIQFNTEIREVQLTDDDICIIITSEGNRIKSKRLVIATGNNSIPSYPSWADELEGGNIQYSHSSSYEKASDFANKRVLIIGGGESGTDIALEVSKVANQCWVSLRNSTGWVIPRKRGDQPSDIGTHRGLWGAPRSLGAMITKALFKMERERNNPDSDAAVFLNEKVKSKLGVFGIYGTKTFALPKAISEFACQVVGEIGDISEDGTKISTKDGEILEDIDAIIFSTGFTNKVSFLPEKLQKIKPRDLYKHMFHPDYGSKITWLGWARPNFGSQFPIMEMQSRWYAQIVKNNCELPEKESMKHEISSWRKLFIEQFENNAERLHSLVDYRIYMDSLAAELGCKPPLLYMFFFKPKLWRKVMYGPLQATQFRISGLGQKNELAEDILLKIPHLPFNHPLVKLGFKARFMEFAVLPITGLFKS